MAFLSVTIDGQQKLSQALDSVGRGISDFRPVFQEVEQWFYALEEKQFQAEGRANKWKPLSAKYAKWKALHYPGKPILERTGALRRSLTGKGAGGIRSLTPMELTLGSSLHYALHHQRGGGRLPTRPPIELTRADEKRLVAFFLEQMAEIGAKGGFDVPFKDLYESGGVSF